MLKVNENGNELWRKTYADFYYFTDVKQTSDGGYILTGGHGVAVLLKTDSLGNEQWRTNLNAWCGYCIDVTNDEGYIIGSILSFFGNVRIIKIDINGTAEWEKTIPLSTTEIYSCDGEQTEDGGYILLTKNNVIPGAHRIWLLKLGKTPPSADAGGPYYGNPGYPVQFDGSESYDNDENGEEITRYDWKFFENDTWHNNVGPKPSHVYNSVGTYFMSLRVWDNEGDNDTDNDTVTIDYQPHPPTADIGGPYYGMENDPILFNASASHDNDENGSSIVQYDWKFYTGDIWHDNLTVTPTHIYTTPGTYTAEVRVHDDEGYTDTDTTTVQIYGYNPPTANTGGPYSGMEGDGVIYFNGSASHDNDEYFIDPNGYTIVNWTWNLGDGTIRYEATTNHIYANEADYTVTLTVQDDEGNSSIGTTVAHIMGYYPPTALPGGPYNGIRNEPVQFNGANSHDNDEGGQSITQYDWKFYTGDTWHTTIGPTPTHIYTSDGTYTVSLRVTDDESMTAQANTTVTITYYFDPTAEAGGPYSGQTYTPITFDASASHDNDEGGYRIVGYRWDWTNDGSYDTDWLPTPVTTHAYNTAFTGSVKLQVKDDEGATATDTAPITIIAYPPTANFQVIKTNNPSTFKFDGSTSSDPRPGHTYKDLTYSWDFTNDGTWDKTGSYSQAGVVTYTYSTSGTKSIKLKVENIDGNNTITKQVSAFIYNDIIVQGSNKNNFFLGYPLVVAPHIFNKYTLTIPKNVFTKVTFQIRNNIVTDTVPEGSDSDTWEGLLMMNEGRNGDKVIVKGYYGDNVVWTKNIDVDIMDIPGWAQAFLMNCNITIKQNTTYSSWKMNVELGGHLGLEFPEDIIGMKMIGGAYRINTSVKYLSKKFSIDDHGTFSIPLIQITVPIGEQKDTSGKKPNIQLGEYKTWSIKGGFKFSVGATLKAVRNGKMSLEGTLTIGGDVTVKFKFPFAGIPFVATVGVEGGMSAGIGVSFVFAKTCVDGVTLAPDGTVVVYAKIGGSAGMYLEILCGLASFGGGVEAEGKFSRRLPDLKRRIELYGGAYAYASALWGLWSKKWTYGLTWDSGWKSDTLMVLDMESYLTDKNKVKSLILQNSDLPCLKNYSRVKERARGTVLLSDNVGESAVPKIILTDAGKGLSVWSDINTIGNGFQSDIFWSIYDGSSWRSVQSTNTSGRCEFDPEIILVNKTGTEYVVLTYLATDQIINLTTDPDTFYAGSRIHTALWNSSTGWSFKGENLVISGGTVNTRSMSADAQGNIYMSYVVDTDSDPWENGICRLFVVNGTILGDEINWNTPQLIDTFVNTPVGFQPQITFINHSIGCLVYQLLNQTSQKNETILLPSITGLTGLGSHRLILNSTNCSVNYISCIQAGNAFVISWVENSSSICQCLVNTNIVSTYWTIQPVQKILTNSSIIFLKPIAFNGRKYLLYQSGEKYTPYILEYLQNGIWGNLRQLSLDESYSLGQIDGDSNAMQTQLIYLRDTSLGEWLVGRWRFNDAEGVNVSDDTGNNNNGVISGNGSWVEQTNETFDPIYGYALRFNDSTGHITIPYNTNLVLSNEFTTTSWANLTTTSTGRNIIGINNSWRLREVNGQLEITLWRSNGQITKSNITVLPVGVWTFIGVIYTNTGLLKITVRPNGMNSTDVVYSIGSYSLIDGGNPLILGGFIGCLDEVWVFNRDISMSEVDSIWFTPYPTLGCLHDVVVQQLPSFAWFDLLLNHTRDQTDSPRNDWYNQDWLYRKQIIINHTKVMTDLQNFPILISTTLDTAKVQSDGDDIVFTDQNGNKLNHEIEDYNSTSSALVAWVNVTSLSSTQDTLIWMYYGNTFCENQQNVASTWDSNYIMVQHLEETSGNHQDSTSNNNDLIVGNITGQGIVSGIIGKGDDFELDNRDYLFDDDIGSYNSYTFEGWVKWESLVDYEEIIANPGPAIQSYGDGRLWIRGGITPPAGTVTSARWYYTVHTGDGENTEFFLDSVSKGIGIDSTDLNGEIILGTDFGFHYWYDGLMDEIRVSKIVRNDNWIKTCYNTIKSPSTFLSFGVEEIYIGEEINITTDDIITFRGSPPGLNFKWDFGDGNTATGQTVSHQYQTTGFYQIICTATDPTTGVVTPVMQELMVIDTTPPTFNGLTTLVPGSCNATLTWNPANDTGPYITYYGFRRNSSSSYNYTQPLFITQNHTYTVEDLPIGETCYFLVRAVDAAGNMEQNLVEKSTTPVDTQPPVFAGITGLYEIVNQRGGALCEWTAAIDNSPPITYNLYIATTPGGQNYNTPYTTTNRTYAELTGLDLQNHSYYIVVRAEDTYTNEDNNTVELSTTPISWEASLFFNEHGGAHDFLVFGESTAALDSVDSFDLPKPPGNSTPRIYSYFTTDESTPYDKLTRDLRHYPAETQQWNLTVLWHPVDNTSLTLITLYWNQSELNISGYAYVGLLDRITGDLVCMGDVENYSFICSSGVPYHFGIFCGDLEPNLPPFMPRNPVPLNNSIVDISMVLSWIGDDPNTADIVTYDVYIGMINPPSKLVDNQSGVVYNPGVLEYNTTYYWRVVSWDNHNVSTAGPVWQFTTSLSKAHVSNLSLSWNFVALPFNQSVDKTNLSVKHDGVEYSWQEAVNQSFVIGFIYGWNRTNQNYGLTDTLNPGYGYWIYAYNDCELWVSGVSGFVSDPYITDLLHNWNIIGLPDNEPVEKQNLTILYDGTVYSWSEAVTNNIIIGFIYQWNETNQNYQLTDVLQPGKSYWMYAYHNCKLMRPIT